MATGHSPSMPYSVQDPSYTATSSIPHRCNARAKIAAVTPVPHDATMGRASALKSKPLASNAPRISSADLNVLSSLSNSPKNTFLLPGMCPERTPSRGSFVSPRKRAAPLASTTWYVASAMFRTISAFVFTNASRVPLKSFAPVSACAITFAHARAGARTVSSSLALSSVSSPAAVQAGKPPSNTRTSSHPLARNIHHARAAENIPFVSYTTIGRSRVNPNVSHAAANASALGNMCGAALAPSDTASTSKYLVVALNRRAQCSTTPFRFRSGMCQLASRICTSLTRARNHSTDTKGSNDAPIATDAPRARARARHSAERVRKNARSRLDRIERRQTTLRAMKIRAPTTMRQTMTSLTRAHPLPRVAASASSSSRARITARASSSSSSASSESPYDALGVARGASREAVKRAYKRMAKLYHPDVCDDAEDTARFLRAKAAYEVLVHATTGDLEDVKTETWKSKWRAQLARLAREAAAAKRGDVEDEETVTMVGTPEMRRQVAGQLAGLRDQGRRRRNVMKPKVRNWEEPFAGTDSDDWNHEVQ